MDWTLRGMDEATRRRAQAAAHAAGLSLAAWLDRTILANAGSYVLPPVWSDEDDAEAETEAPDPFDDPAAQEAIQQVLGVLEARLQTAEDNVTRLVTPMSAQLDGLAERAAANGLAETVKAVSLPGLAYRRRLGMLAGGVLFLAFAAAGGLVWLWFDMNEPTPTHAATAFDDDDAANMTTPLIAIPVNDTVMASAADSKARPSSLPPAQLAAPTPIDIDAPPAESADVGNSPSSASAAPAQPAATPGTKPLAVAAADKAPTSSITPPAASGVVSATPPPPPAPGALSTGDAQLVAQLRADAAKGAPKAQHDLALLLMEGRLLPRDEKTATDLFEKAAVQGLANAQYNLGVIYDHGIGRPADQAMAYFWYSAAADQGHVAAQYNLGVAAAQGRGAPRDYDVAAVWFRRAAEGGLPDAQYNLGQLYENGFGVPLDLDAAYELYRQAANAGYTPARTRMIGLEAKLSPSLQPASPAPRVTAAPPTSTTTTSTVQALTRKDIVELQTLLRKLALLKTNADGNLGATTRTAIKQYQEMAGLPPTGEPSPDLLSELREVAN
jgi:localization factor PodJL